MPRFTLISWRCLSGHPNVPEDARCITCGANRIERYAQVRESERAVVYINPRTGERRTPARADQPMPAVYANQGFERREITNMTQFQRETGLVHEATDYSSIDSADRSTTPDQDYKPVMPNDLRAKLAESISTADWTPSEV